MAVFLAASAGPAIYGQTTSVSIPAWIEGEPCGDNLKFEATLNSNPVPVTAQLGPGSDQILLLVYDLTGDLSLIEAAKQAALAEISRLPPNVWVGLLRDQDGLRVLSDPAQDRQPLIEALQSLSNSGEPGLLGAVPSALVLADAILRKSPVRATVLYLTDGSIYSYREDYTDPVINESDPHDLSRRLPGSLIQERVSKLVKDSGSLEAPLFVVHLNYRRDRLNVVYQNGLKTLAEATGGKAVICSSLAEIPEAISHIFARITSEWRLNLEVPAKVHSNSQIHLSAPCRNEGLRLSWRTHFRPRGG